MRTHAGRATLRPEKPMRLVAVPALLIAAVVATAAGDGARWQRLPAAPVPATISEAVGAFTGHELVVVVRAQPHPPRSVDRAAAYNPATRSWRTLKPLAGPAGNYEGRYRAVWTGSKLLVLGPLDNQSYDPRTNVWRRLPQPKGGAPNGVVVWTGRELISWGGGCCGDASRSGVAYDPATNRWSALPASPLAPSQSPSGVWTGRELVIAISGLDPDGKAYAARYARAAAYNPTTRTWRRLPAPPTQRAGAVAVWDGSRALFLGGAAAAGGRTVARTGLAYDPARNRWSTLPRMPVLGYGFAALRAGGRVVAWGGTGRRAAEYVPAAGRWFSLPAAPIRARADPLLAWTGGAVLVWGGRDAADGAQLSF